FKPEAKVWSVSDAPAWDKDAFLSGSFCWKVWGAWRPIWCALRQKVTGLTPNIKYRFTVPVHPDLVIDEQGGGKQYAPDLLSGEARLVATFAGQSVDTGWKDGTQMPFGKYTSLTLEFTPTTTEVTVAVEFRGRWGIEHNGWFFDSFTLEALPSAQSQPQPRAAQPSATQPRPLPPQPPQPLRPQPLAPQPPRPQPLAPQPKLLPQIVPGGAGMSVPQPLPSRPQPIPPRPQPKPLPTQPQPVAPPRPQPAQSPVAPQPQAQPPAPAPRQPPPVPPDVKLENVTIKNRLFDYSLDGWETWAVVREGRCERQRPNFESYRSPVPPFRVLISHTALRISIEAGKSYEAGVYQRVSGITPGTPLRYVAQGHTWSSTGDDPFRSEGADRATMKVGIDPFGGADPMAGTVVWSNPVDSFDEYREIEVRTVAMNETITLFLYAHPTACIKHNESFWDDNRLYSTGPAIAISPESPAPVTPAPQPPPDVPAPVPASRPPAGGEAVGDNPTGANLLRNGDFDGGYYNTAPELAIPNEWDLWFAEQMTPKLPRQDTPFLKPETVVWNIKDAPEWEKSQFFLSGNFCWKVFGAWKPIWVRLSQRVTGLTPGSPYRFTVPFHPDLVNSYEKDGKHYAPDLLSGEHRLSATFAGTTVETGWKDGHDVPFGKYTRLSLDFTPTTSEVTVALEFRGRWGLANCGWFVDSASLQMLSGSGGTVTAAAMPSFTPAPVAPAPVTPAPARPPASSPSGGIEGGRGVTGKLDLIDNKPTYAARSDAFPGERIRVRETIVNNTNQPISYGVLGVKATAVGGGQGAFQTSWSGNLSIGPGQTGPDNGRAWEDGLFLTAGTYNLTLSICYSSVDDCLGGKGRWEELTPPVTVKVINWTP
ncbi:MAG: hypothetical protein HY023_18750, partial [Chloroflexi bacterium]|nr:hypothetical protein [Chloroflexota bacterium]